MLRNKRLECWHWFSVSFGYKKTIWPSMHDIVFILCWYRGSVMWVVCEDVSSRRLFNVFYIHHDLNESPCLRYSALFGPTYSILFLIIPGYWYGMLVFLLLFGLFCLLRTGSSLPCSDFFLLPSSSSRSHLVVGSLRQTQFSSSQFCHGPRLSSFRRLSCLSWHSPSISASVFLAFFSRAVPSPEYFFLRSLGLASLRGQITWVALSCTSLRYSLPAVSPCCFRFS